MDQIEILQFFQVKNNTTALGSQFQRLSALYCIPLAHVINHSLIRLVPGRAPARLRSRNGFTGFEPYDVSKSVEVEYSFKQDLTNSLLKKRYIIISINLLLP